MYTKSSEFFWSVIGPKIHFEVELQDYIKANVRKIYHDIVEEYYRIQERKRSVSAQQYLDNLKYIYS